MGEWGEYFKLGPITRNPSLLVCLVRSLDRSKFMSDFPFTVTPVRDLDDHDDHEKSWVEWQKVLSWPSGCIVLVLEMAGGNRGMIPNTIFTVEMPLLLLDLLPTGWTKQTTPQRFLLRGALLFRPLKPLQPVVGHNRANPAIMVRQS